jgi:lipoate-protein ligase A
MNSWYYVPYKCLSGEMNMNIDHSIATHFSEIGTPILRFFGWTPHALSIGFHQKISEFNFDQIKDEAVDIIRRPTGGRAIYHGNELTYSVIIPKVYMKKSELYRRIHKAFIEGFRELGLEIDLNKSQANLGHFYKTKESISCFAASAKYEATNNGKKFIGSAQRVYDDAILQHGSIMLSDDFFKVLRFSNLSAEEKELAHQKLKEKTFYWDIEEGKISIETLCNTLARHFSKEFAIHTMEEIPFELETWKYLDECKNDLFYSP